MSTYFPDRFDQAAEQANFWQQQQRRLLALCDYVVTQDHRHLDTLAQIDGWLLELSRPDIFDDGDARNVLVAQRKGFGQLCAALAEHGYPQATELSTFQFHSAIDYLKEKHQPRD